MAIAAELMAFFALGSKERSGGREGEGLGSLSYHGGTVAPVTHTHWSQGRPKEQELALDETAHDSLGQR